MKIMGVDKSRVMLKHPAKDTLFGIDQAGELTLYPLNCGLAGKVMQTGEYENLTNGYGDPLFNGQVDLETHMPLLCYPIKHPVTEKTMGIIEVINSRGIQGLSTLQKAKVSPYDLETLDFMARQLAQAVLNCFEWEKLGTEKNGKPYRFEETVGKK
jgi:hypothetical protein